MKKMMTILLALVMSFALTACMTIEKSEETEKPSQSEEITVEPSKQGDGAKVLVAYFTWAENAVLDEGVDVVSSPSVVVPGNVQQLATWVQDETGGDIFSIRVADPYPSDWDDCLERANAERGNDDRPELLEKVENIDQYTTVFLGYPNWWYGVPMALLSFLEQNDLSHKDVYLFCSHGTGGLANSVEQITAALPEVFISNDIFDCYEDEAASSEDEIRSWVNSLGYSRSEETNDSDGKASKRQISVRSGDNTIIYALNDSRAATSLYAMLPLSVEVEDYSDNEKIFYPQEDLDISDAPLAQGKSGTLAYYEPWGDVVFFYGDYNENPGLFELGQVISGEEFINQMSGTITIESE